MTDQQSSPGGDPVVGLQPLTFVKETDNSQVAVFQALIDNSDAVYTLTVTLASPGIDEEANKELNEFLSQMLAGFALTASTPGKGLPDSEPFNYENQIKIEAGVVELREAKGDVDVIVGVQTTAKGAPSVAINYGIGPGKEHWWSAIGGLQSGTVTAEQGSGNVRPPKKPVIIGPSVTAYGNPVIVACDPYSAYFKYGFSGRFHHPPRLR
jgi:hypothetical protein